SSPESTCAMALRKFALTKARLVASKSSALSSTMRMGCDSRSFWFESRFMTRRLQGEIECGAFARLGLEPDFAAVTLDDFLHEGQADAGAFFRFLAGLEPLEDAEDFLVEFGLNAQPVVSHEKHFFADASVRCGFGRQISDLDGRFGLVVVFDRVGDEIAEQFGNPSLVAGDDGELFGRDDPRAAFPQEMLERGFDVGDDDIQVRRLDGKLLTS